jgi:hypothetical protein
MIGKLSVEAIYKYNKEQDTRNITEHDKPE